MRRGARGQRPVRGQRTLNLRAWAGRRPPGALREQAAAGDISEGSASVLQPPLPPQTRGALSLGLVQGVPATSSASHVVMSGPDANPAEAPC